jgi:hypothetical protein
VAAQQIRGPLALAVQYEDRDFCSAALAREFAAQLSDGEGVGSGEVIR